MIRIAIVDDDVQALEQLKHKLKKYSKENDFELTVTAFTEGKTFLKTVAKERFDMVFLDIDLPEMNGIRIAKYLRKSELPIIIVFCTNLEQYAIEGYTVDALGYLLKPIKDYSLRLVMDKVRKSFATTSVSRIFVKTQNGQAQVLLEELVYIEVMRHNLYFHSVTEEGKEEIVRARGTMREISEQLKGAYFSRCSVSYLVNLKRVLSISGNTVDLPGSSLLISRTYKKAFTDDFMKYLSEDGGTFSLKGGNWE